MKPQKVGVSSRILYTFNDNYDTHLMKGYQKFFYEKELKGSRVRKSWTTIMIPRVANKPLWCCRIYFSPRYYTINRKR